jgi:hypothetical protein
MNTARRITTTIVGVVVTCVLSAGAAAAHPDSPLGPSGAAIPVASQVAPAHPSAGTKTQALLRQQAYAEHMQRLFAEREAAEVAARRQAEVGQRTAAQSGSGTTSHDSGNATTAQSVSGTTSHDSGNGSDVPVLAVTALAGLALGAAGSSASRRLRQRPAFPK